MSIVRFVRNYTDLSTDSGFQFEFYCDRCGSGYQTRFVAGPQNVVGNVLDAAGNLFGGLFHTASQFSEHARSVAWQKAKDAHFRQAVEEARPVFKQCRPCGRWVDDICWNARKKQCQECVESNASGSESEAEDPAPAKRASGRRSGRKAKTITCPECDTAGQSGKFCTDCGASLPQATGACHACGHENPGNAKFCPECGEKQ